MKIESEWDIWRRKKYTKPVVNVTCSAIDLKDIYYAEDTEKFNTELWTVSYTFLKIDLIIL